MANAPVQTWQRVQRSIDRQNMQMLVQLRWLAVVGQVLTISLVHHGLGIDLPLPGMALVLLALVLLNLGSIVWWRSHRRPIAARHLFAALLADVLALAVQLYFSGGVGNPFIFLFLLQGILGAVVLRAHHAWCLVLAIWLCALALALVQRPLQFMNFGGAAAPPPPLYTVGVLISLGLTTVLLVVFLRRIVANLRRRDARWAAMRQRASEEEHIVRMGLLATGAAHELGTPLATMSVILGDWQHLPALAQDAQWRADLHDMQQQLLRCKAIVSGVLLSAGKTRADAPHSVLLSAFVETVTAHWRTRHAVQRFDCTLGGADFAMVSDTALRQMLGNVLDNAAEASPAYVALHLRVHGGFLSITVRDHGAGFAPAVLHQWQQRPWLSTPTSKTTHAGRGLGLFLTHKVAQSLGGSVQLRNIPPRGAQVQIRLPLSALQVPSPHDAAPAPPAAAG